MSSLLIEGKIHDGLRLFDGYVLLEDGLVSGVGLGWYEGAADSRVKLGNKQVALPGLIDMHVHLRDFELEYKEDFHTGTRAAAKGGLTVVADMPNTRPKVNRPSLLVERDRIARSKAVVDYGLYYGVSREVDERVKLLALGFKVYSHEEYYKSQKEEVLATLQHASSAKMPVLVHAENPELFEEGGARPPIAERSAIETFASLARTYGFQLHITHASSGDGAVAISDAKRLSPSVTADTCPHYILLTEGEVDERIAKVHPPLRSEDHRKAVLTAFIEGALDALSSDHAPHALCEKVSHDPPGGFPGLETMLALMTTLVDKGLVTLDRLVSSMSTIPARILHLNKLGLLLKGFVGNVTIIDLNKEWIIDSSEFESKAKYSPFDGYRVKGKALATVVRGEVVMEGDEVKVTRGGTNVKSYG